MKYDSSARLTLLQLLYRGSKFLALCKVMGALVLPLSHNREPCPLPDSSCLHHSKV